MSENERRNAQRLDNPVDVDKDLYYRSGDMGQTKHTDPSLNGVFFLSGSNCKPDVAAPGFAIVRAMIVEKGMVANSF